MALLTRSLVSSGRRVLCVRLAGSHSSHGGSSHGHDEGHKSTTPKLTEITPDIKAEIAANYQKYKDQVPKLSPQEQAQVEAWRKEILTSDDPAQVGGFGVTGVVPDTYLQVTGKERAEIIEIAKGNLDPWGFNQDRSGPVGTKDKPREIPSTKPWRIVGCICDEEAESILWTKLHWDMGSVPCPCGQEYYKLVPVKSPLHW
jgi:cytochrome c oxidase subunit 5b